MASRAVGYLVEIFSNTKMTYPKFYTACRDYKGIQTQQEQPPKDVLR